MFIVWKARKSTGSGAVLQQPPKKSGYATCNQSEDQPPEECPVTKRAWACGRARKRPSISGMSSWTSASPTGPLFAELAKTEWPSGTSGSSTTRNMGSGTSPFFHLAPERVFSQDEAEV